MHYSPKSYEKVPIEIWEYILILVIDKTLLLSPDPFEYNNEHEFKVPDDWVCPMYEVDEDKNLYWGMKDQPAMRQFRRLRALLRLVCRSWKRFADSANIESRIARLCVPSHPDEDIQPEVLVLAKRLEVVDPRRNPNQLIEGIIKRTVEEKRIFNAEIVIDVGGLLSMQFLRHYPKTFPSLSSLYLDLTNPSITTISDYELDGIFTALPSLACLVIMLDRRLSLPMNDFCLNNLVSLSISSPSLQGLNFGMWRLPKLRHLRIKGMRCPVHPARLGKYIHQLGYNLTYLSLTTDGYPDIWNLSLKTIWTHCPHITHLEIPLHLILREREYPPQRWPLAHLGNTSNKPLAYAEYGTPASDLMTFYGQVATFCSGCLKLKTITDTHIWLNVMLHVYSPIQKQSDGSDSEYLDKVKQREEDTANATLVLASKLEAMGIRYEDGECRSLAEATAFIG